MKTKITVKRKKTIKAARPEIEEAGAEEVEAAEGDEALEAAEPVAAAPVPVQMAPVKTASYTWAAIVGIIAVLILLSSLLAVVYVWRVVEIAYFRPAPKGGVAVREAPLSMLVPTWIMVGASIWFGIDAANTVSIAETAAAALLGGSP